MVGLSGQTLKIIAKNIIYLKYVPIDIYNCDRKFF